MLEPKVRALLTKFKKDGFVGKIYIVNDMGNSCSAIISNINYGQMTAYQLYKLLKIKGIQISKVEPLNPQKIRVTFVPYKNENGPQEVVSFISTASLTK